MMCRLINCCRVRHLGIGRWKGAWPGSSTERSSIRLGPGVVRGDDGFTSGERCKEHDREIAVRV
eukprot:6287368-Prymnesium_polylepis.1